MTDLISVDVQDVSELPWIDIERAAETTFTHEQKKKIFEFWRQYMLVLKFFEQSVTIAQVEKLRDELIDLSRRLYVSGMGAFRDPAKRAMFHQVTWYLGRDVKQRLQEAATQR